jgi:hypothetical protein
VHPTLPSSTSAKSAPDLAVIHFARGPPPGWCGGGKGATAGPRSAGEEVAAPHVEVAGGGRERRWARPWVEADGGGRGRGWGPRAGAGAAASGGGRPVGATEGEGAVERRREKGGIFPRNALVREGFPILRLPLRLLLEPVEGSPLPHFTLMGWDGEAAVVSLIHGQSIICPALTSHPRVLKVYA